LKRIMKVAGRLDVDNELALLDDRRNCHCPLIE
jgi:hypothetical protein